MRFIIIFVVLMGKILADSGTVMIEISYKGEDYQIVRAWKIEQRFPPTLQSMVKSEDDILVEIKDKNGDIVEVLRLENPRLVRGILAEKKSSEGHENIMKEEGVFTVRYTYNEGLKYLNIINIKPKEPLINHYKTTVSLEKDSNMEFKTLLK